MKSLKSSQQGLEKIKQAREAKEWTVDDETWLEEASKFLPKAKSGKKVLSSTVSIGTWKRFLRGIPIRAYNYKAFCQILGLNWEEVVEHSLPMAYSSLRSENASNSQTPSNSYHRQDWGEAPDISVFYGRTNELNVLGKWIITDRCRLVAILGMRGIGKTGLSVKLGKGGIGKTDLSLKLARGIQDEFDYVIWRRLLNAPPLTEVLADLIKFLSNQHEVDLPDLVDARISRLLYYLKVHRCLLILDNAEAILQDGDRAGQYRKGYEDYGQLFRRIGEVSHQSCLLLNSREKPQEIALLEGKTKPVRSLRISGLDVADGRKIFMDVGDFYGSDNEWKKLIEFYDGNPLVLEIVAKHIEEVFLGDISTFLKEGKAVFGNLCDLLNWHFERLSDLEKEIMYWLAINREPVCFLELREDVLSIVAKRNLSETLQSLQLRLPIEKGQAGFTLQPVLIEYMTKRLVEQVCKEIETSEIKLLNSHALSKVLVKEYVRISQCRLIIQPIQDNLVTLLGNKKNLEYQLNRILSTLQKDINSKRGYAGGNIINLLSQMQIDLSGYDFSNLAVWQACLRDVNLQYVNFTNSDLTKSVFTQTFGSILSVAFSSDGKFLVTGDTGGEIRLWQAADGQPRLTFEGHTDWVRSVAFSPNSQIMASSSADSTVRLWNVNTGECLKILKEHFNGVWSVKFSPDGQIVASASADQTVKLWDVSTGQCLKNLQGHALWVGGVSFSPDGQTIASGSGDKTIKLWDVNTGECLKNFQGHTDWVLPVSFSPDGQTIASGSGDKTIKLWDVNTGKCLKSFQGHTHWIQSIDFSPNSQTIVSSSEDKTIRLWDVNTGDCLKTLQDHTNSVWSVAFSSDSRTVASGSNDQTIRLWDVNTGQCLKTLQGHTHWIHSVAFSPDGKTIVSGSNDQTVRLWNVNSGQCLRIWQGHVHWIRSVAFSQDGQTIASGSADGTVKIWSISTDSCVKTLRGHKNWINAIAFSPDAQIIISGSGDHTVIVWDVNSGQCLKTLCGHTDWIQTVAFSSDNQTIASGNTDQTIKLWNITNSNCLKTLQGHTSRIKSIAFSPDGQSLVSGSDDQTVRLWDITTGKCLKTWQEDNYWIGTVAFSPDGQIIASGGSNQIVKLYNISNGECLNTLQGHSHWVTSVSFSPDGQILLSGSEDETMRLWDVKTGRCIKILRVRRPYEGMNITGISCLTEAQKATLKTLGAVENI